MTRKWMCGLCAVAVAVAAIGCGMGPDDQPELADVSGTVTLDGKPYEGAQVVFGPTTGRSSSAITDQEGYYELNYLPDEPGAKIGTHKVAISTYLEDESDPEMQNFVDPIPAKYNRNTTLTYEVKPGNNENVNFDLKSK